MSGSILDAAGVAKAMAHGAIVWDVRPTDKYYDGHIPGAVSVGDATLVLVDEHTQRLAPVADIARVLGDAGLDLKGEIVVYGRIASPNAYFAEWVLDYFGARKVDVFHDGFEGWKAAGRPISTDPVKRKHVRIRPFANPSMLATMGEVISREKSPVVQFVDVRRFGEYNGDESETQRSGHIPGAVHIPYNLALVDPEAPMKLMSANREESEARELHAGMHLKPAAELRKVYGGLDPKKETIVYCQVGARAAMTAALLNKLGFKSIRVYFPGWIEYGNNPDAPIE